MVAKNYASGGLNGAEDRVGVAWKGARSSVVTVFLEAPPYLDAGRRLGWVGKEVVMGVIECKIGENERA